MNEQFTFVSKHLVRQYNAMLFRCDICGKPLPFPLSLQKNISRTKIMEEYWPHFKTHYEEEFKKGL